MFRVELRTAEERDVTEELAARIVETQVREAAIVATVRFTGVGAATLLELGELRAERGIYASLLFSV